MAKKSNEEIIPLPIEKLTLDYSRDDLNNIARKINEIIEALQSK